MKCQAPWRIAILAGAICACWPALVHAQTSTLDGILTAVWGDPEPGSARPAQLHWMLHGDRGETVEVQLPADLVQRLGGVHAIDRRRVTARGMLRVPAPTDTVSTPILQASTLQAAGPALTAAQPVSRPFAVLLCKFSDDPTEPRTPGEFTALMGGGYPNMEHYYQEISNGRASFAGSAVFGWFTLPQPKSYYVSDALTLGTTLTRITDDCTAAADPVVNFAAFHGIALQFNGNLATSGSGSAYGGSRFLALDGAARVWPMTWMPLWAAQHSMYGVYAHEIGHALGLPHSSGPYNQVYDSNWDVMSNSYLRWDNSVGGWIPGQTIAFHKDMLGWIPAGRRVHVAGPLPQNITLDAHSTFAGNGALHVTVPIPGTGAYYSIEARHQHGYDTHLPGAAVIIHRVPTGSSCTGNQCARLVDGDNNGNPNDGGAMWLPGEAFDDGLGIRVEVTGATATGWAIRVTPGNALAVVSAGTGSGTVKGGSPAINCSVAAGATTGTCGAAYYGNPNVTLTATPAPGHTFVGWSGACTGTASCVVAMDRARDVSVAFAPPVTAPANFTVATTSFPSALAGTTSGGGTYTAGSPVTVKATPAAGHAFTKWLDNDVVVSISASYTFSASADRALVAHFAPVAAEHVLEAAASGTGAGAVVSRPGGVDCRIADGRTTGVCAAPFTAGETVTLTATPAPGHSFAGWSLACSTASSSTCTVTVSQATRVAAVFTAPVVIGTASTPAAGGTTTGAGSYPADSTVTVAAQAAAGYRFVHWSEHGAVVSASASYSFVATGNRTLVAHFMKQHTLSVEVQGSGRGSVVATPDGIDCQYDDGRAAGACSASYAAGTRVTLIASPAAGQLFDGWSGECSGSGACIVDMDQARSIAATFTAQHSVSTSSSPAIGGTTAGSGTYRAGAQVTVSAVAHAGYDFIGWTEDSTSVSADASHRFILTGSRTLVARFVRRTYTVTVAAQGDGSAILTSSPAGIECSIVAGVPTGTCTAAFEHDSEITFTVIPTAGSVFTRWSGCTERDGACAVIATEPHSVAVSLLSRPAALTLARATDALIGKATLTAAEIEYLDSIGNRNGRFDSGDLLALRAQQQKEP